MSPLDNLEGNWRAAGINTPTESILLSRPNTHEKGAFKRFNLWMCKTRGDSNTSQLIKQKWEINRALVLLLYKAGMKEGWLTAGMVSISKTGGVLEPNGEAAVLGILTLYRESNVFLEHSLTWSSPTPFLLVRTKGDGTEMTKVGEKKCKQSNTIRIIFGFLVITNQTYLCDLTVMSLFSGDQWCQHHKWFLYFFP